MEFFLLASLRPNNLKTKKIADSINLIVLLKLIKKKIENLNIEGLKVDKINELRFFQIDAIFQ